MKYAVIKNGKVINTVIADAEFALEQNFIECPDSVGIDWDYDGTNFVDNRSTDVVSVVVTKEELLQKIQLLTNQVQSLP